MIRRLLGGAGDVIWCNTYTVVLYLRIFEPAALYCNNTAAAFSVSRDIGNWGSQEATDNSVQNFKKKNQNHSDIFLEGHSNIIIIEHNYCLIAV
jgi:hypothetical protein